TGKHDDDRLFTELHPKFTYCRALLLKLRRGHIIEPEKYKKEHDCDLGEIEEKLRFKARRILVLVQEKHHCEEQCVQAEKELHRGTWRGFGVQKEFVVRPTGVRHAPGCHSATHKGPERGSHSSRPARRAEAHRRGENAGGNLENIRQESACRRNSQKQRLCNMSADKGGPKNGQLSEHSCLFLQSWRRMIPALLA